MGYFDLVIKVYEGKTIERFPDGGKMSQYFESLSVGDAIDIQGPFGLYEYNGMGDFTVKRKPRSFTHVGMIAGGTGVSVMDGCLVRYQSMRARCGFRIRD